MEPSTSTASFLKLSSACNSGSSFIRRVIVPDTAFQAWGDFYPPWQAEKATPNSIDSQETPISAENRY